MSGIPYRILNMNHKKELLRGLWVQLQGVALCRPGAREVATPHGDTGTRDVPPSIWRPVTLEVQALNPKPLKSLNP